MARRAYSIPPAAAARPSGWRGVLLRLGGPAHAILRVGAGLLFVEHGVQKLFGLLGGFGGHPGATAPLGSLLGVAGILEFVGGLLLVVGFLTRPAALVLAGEMITAAVLVHLPRGGWPLENAGELPLLYAVVFLFFVGNGAGPASIDSLVWPQRTEPPPRPLARPPFEPRRSGW